MAGGGKKKKVMVTGAGGQLGYDCLQVLSPDYEACGLTSRELDITDAGAVEAAFSAFRPGAVINCAAYTRVDACEAERETCWAVNGHGPAHLAKAAGRHGAFLIHVSTDYVFDGRRPVPGPYTEFDAPAPVSWYGKSKLEGERSVIARADRYAIVRTAWLYGISGRNFLKTVLRLALSRPEKVIRVVDDQYGSATWSFRLALQIREILESGATGLFHATAEEYGTWYGLAAFFLDQVGVSCELVPCTTREYPTAAVRPANSILENQRLKEEGIHVMRPWKEDVAEFARRFRDRLLAEARAGSRL